MKKLSNTEAELKGRVAYKKRLNFYQKYLLILTSNFHLNVSQNKKRITLSNFLKLLIVTFSPSVH